MRKAVAIAAVVLLGIVGASAATAKPSKKFPQFNTIPS
jgi:hypothetical protein